MRILNLEQGSRDWLIWRSTGIGGSDAVAILGESPYATREQLMLEKLGLAVREGNFSMRRGNRLEPMARSLYALDLPGLWSVQPVCVVHEDCDWLKASLDGLVCDADLNPRKVCEIKCWAWTKHDWCLQGLVPREVRAQIQHQLLVTGLSECDLVSYTENGKFSESRRIATVTVEADAEYQGRLLEECEKFWAELQARKAELAVVA